jgi:hypothetical protein
MMKSFFCSVNADTVKIDDLIRDLERFREEAHVAGFSNLIVEIDANRKMWIAGEKK